MTTQHDLYRQFFSFYKHVAIGTPSTKDSLSFSLKKDSPNAAGRQSKVGETNAEKKDAKGLHTR